LGVAGGKAAKWKKSGPKAKERKAKVKKPIPVPFNIRVSVGQYGGWSRRRRVDDGLKAVRSMPSLIIWVSVGQQLRRG